MNTELSTNWTMAERTCHQPLAEGTVIAGKYVIRGLLGQGGFCVVYEAEHMGLARRVAIKMYLPSSDDLALLPRWRREAKLSASVRHPNVLEVYDTGFYDDGTPFLVMECIEGETLAARLERGVLPIGSAVELGIQLLRALEALSAHRLLHRDIKPENIMLRRVSEGSEPRGSRGAPEAEPMAVKLVDFGICRPLIYDASTSLTCAGALIGTPQYMSPEQISGQPLDERSDLYAVGAVLYEALTGTPPHVAPTIADQIIATVQERVRPLRPRRADCPRALEHLVLQALAKDPADRPPSARAMREALEAAVKPASQAAGSLASRERKPFPERRRQLAWAAALSLASLSSAAAPEAARREQPAVAISSALLRSSAEEPALRSSPDAASPESSAASLHSLADDDSNLVMQLESAAPTSTRASVTHARHADHAGDSKVQRPQEEASAPGEPPSQAPVASYEELMGRALAAQIRGQLAAAQQLYQQATQVAPARASAWRGLWLIAGRLNQPHEAEEARARFRALTAGGSGASASAQQGIRDFEGRAEQRWAVR